MNEGFRTPLRTACGALAAALALAFAPLLVQGTPLSAPVPAEADARAMGSSSSAMAPDYGSGLDALRLELSRFLTTGTARNGSWGFLAVSLAQGDTLFALNPDVPRAPASNQKIFTTAAALHHLGPDFRFPTFLLAEGAVSDGVLHGNLILYGTGDPTIGDRLLPDATAPLRSFARELRERGIHTVAGDILGDGTFFHGPPRRPSWNPRDLNEWYAAPVSGLTFNENMVTLRISPGAPGERPRILTEPAGAVLPLANEGWTVSGRPASTLRLVRDDPDDPIRLLGEMGPGQADVWRRLTVSDPAAFAASVMLTVLEEEGIRVTGVSRSVAGRDASAVSGRTIVAPAFQRGDGPDTWTVAVHHSPPLIEALEVVNKRSHNLYSELILFTLGKIVRGEGTFAGGSQALADYLVRVAGVPAEGLHMEDGSGLSRLNRASPDAFVRVLQHMDAGDHRELFWNTMPEAGNQRELRRMYRSLAAGNLRAKTGTINRVSALSGIVHSRDGEPILFSIIANDVPSSWAAKQVEDRIGIQLASFSRPFAEVVEAESGGSVRASSSRSEPAAQLDP